MNIQFVNKRHRVTILSAALGVGAIIPPHMSAPIVVNRSAVRAGVRPTATILLRTHQPSSEENVKPQPIVAPAPRPVRKAPIKSIVLYTCTGQRVIKPTPVIVAPRPKVRPATVQRAILLGQLYRPPVPPRPSNQVVIPQPKVSREIGGRPRGLAAIALHTRLVANAIQPPQVNDPNVSPIIRVRRNAPKSILLRTPGPVAGSHPSTPIVSPRPRRATTSPGSFALHTRYFVQALPPHAPTTIIAPLKRRPSAPSVVSMRTAIPRQVVAPHVFAVTGIPPRRLPAGRTGLIGPYRATIAPNLPAARVVVAPLRRLGARQSQVLGSIRQRPLPPAHPFVVPGRAKKGGLPASLVRTSWSFRPSEPRPIVFGGPPARLRARAIGSFVVQPPRLQPRAEAPSILMISAPRRLPPTRQSVFIWTRTHASIRPVALQIVTNQPRRRPAPAQQFFRTARSANIAPHAPIVIGVPVKRSTAPRIASLGCSLVPPRIVRPRLFVAQAPTPKAKSAIIQAYRSAFNQPKRVLTPAVIARPYPVRRLPVASILLAIGTPQRSLPARPLIIKAPPARRLPPASFDLRHWPKSPIQGVRRPPVIVVPRPPWRLPAGLPASQLNYLRSVPAAGLPNDLFAAMVTWMRLNTALVAVLGDSTATPKIFADKAEGSPAMPYAVYLEENEDKTRFSAGFHSLWIGRGSFSWRVTAATKLAARQISDAIIRVIEDAPLTFADGVLLELTSRQPSAVRIADPAPGAPIAYARSVSFRYVVERTY